MSLKHEGCARSGIQLIIEEVLWSPLRLCDAGFISLIVCVCVRLPSINAQTGQWELVDKISEVRMHYVTGLHPWDRSLLWDLIATFPFLQVGCGVWSSRAGSGVIITREDGMWFDGAMFLMYCSMFRLLKYLRLWRMAEVSESINRNSPNLANLLTIVRLITILFFTAHYLSCVWFYISPKDDLSEEGWIFNEGGIIPRSPDNWLYEWITCMYWAITTMTTIGYGDISAHTIEERIFAMFAMVLGSAYFAWLAGTITGILASGSAGTEKFLGFLDEVRQYLDVKRFSDEVKKMVFVFYGLKYPTQLIFNDKEIMDELPLGLKKRMQAETYMNVIETIPLFAEVSESTRVEICDAFETYFCSRHEKLTIEDEEPDCLFIVSHGEVLLTHQGETISIARRGQMFGELGLFGLTVTGRRSRSGTSLSECELLRMSKHAWKKLVLTHGDLRNVFRKLTTRHLRVLEAEALKPDSPVYDKEKYIHINEGWQTGRVSEVLRLPGKVLTPHIAKHDGDSKMMQTQIQLVFTEIKGIPIFAPEKSSVTIRIVVEWDSKNGYKKSQHEVTYQQGLPVIVDWRCILKYEHEPVAEQNPINNPPIIVKIIFVKSVETPHGPAAGMTASLGFPEKGSTDLGTVQKVLPLTSKTVHVPLMETEISVMEFPMRMVVDRVKLPPDALSDKWAVGNHAGPLHVFFSTDITRELSMNSTSRAKMRSILKRIVDRRNNENKDAGAVAEQMEAHKDVLPISTNEVGKGLMAWMPDLMRKDLWELKRGVAAVLAKGDHGKGGVSATSFEHTQEKMTDEILQRMRDMKEQIADVKGYVTNFEFNMGEEFLATFETLDKRVDVVLKQHAKMKEHLVEVQARREQHANEIKAAIAAAEAQSRQRDMMIIDMIQQVAKKQGLMLSLVPPVQVAVPAPQVAASAPSRSPSYSPSRRRTSRAGVGLKVGNIQESLINGRQCHYMIVQGLVAGSAAESSGHIKAGDAVSSRSHLLPHIWYA